MGAGLNPKGYLLAICSAALVGLFTVINKWLLESLPPFTAGAWTYMAAALVLFPFALRAGFPRLRQGRVFLAWLAAGSLLGPGLYFWGLKLTSGVEGSLLINTEAVFTALIAMIVFNERMRWHELVFGSLIIVGGLWLAASGGISAILSDGLRAGNLLIILGYLGWAAENNLGRVLGTAAPPVSLVCIKALGAAIMMAVLALISGQPLALPVEKMPGVIASGAFSLGLSLACFYSAMQYIGAARTGLISSSSMLFGIAGSLVFLDEVLTTRGMEAGVIMVFGVAGLAWGVIRKPRQTGECEIGERTNFE